MLSFQKIFKFNAVICLNSIVNVSGLLVGVICCVGSGRNYGTRVASLYFHYLMHVLYMHLKISIHDFYTNYKVFFYT
jgi:hypothetical protein